MRRRSVYRPAAPFRERQQQKTPSLPEGAFFVKYRKVREMHHEEVEKKAFEVCFNHRKVREMHQYAAGTPVTVWYVFQSP